MKELEQIKCPKCGYKNIKLTKKCTKCHYDLDVNNKSCPKCGRINSNATKKCECGFDFTKKKRTLLGNLIITVIVMVLLFFVYKYCGNLIEKYDKLINVLLIFGVFVMLVKAFTSLKGEEMNYSAEEEMVDKQKTLVKMKSFSNLSIIVGGIVAAIYLIYYYVFK